MVSSYFFTIMNQYPVPKIRMSNPMRNRPVPVNSPSAETLLSVVLGVQTLPQSRVLHASPSEQSLDSSHL